MSDRTLPSASPQTQCNKLKIIPFTLLPNGSSAPSIGEGDGNGQYIKAVHTATGEWTISTVDKYQAIVAMQASLMLATPAAAHDLVWGVPTHNSDHTWSITLYHFSGGSAADITADANNRIFVTLSLRDSTLTP